MIEGSVLMSGTLELVQGQNPLEITGVTDLFNNNSFIAGNYQQQADGTLELDLNGPGEVCRN